MAIKSKPPRFADRFLAWYCNPQLLEEIQGDAYELYHRVAKENKRRADLLFTWNVIRFFRWKNIRRFRQRNTHFLFSSAMFKNIFLVTVRNFFKQPVHSTLNVFGLTGGFVCVFLILLWVSHEFSFDRFHTSGDRIQKILTHVESGGTFQTFDVASAAVDVSSVPEIESKVTISDGSRWPHVLCFRPEQKANECIYLTGIYSNESLFSVFDFPILAGDPNPLSKSKSVAISQNMAEKLFGAENPVGKTIKLDDVYEVTIASVFQNVPVTSTIQFDFVLPLSVLQVLWGQNEEQFSQHFFPTYIKTSSIIPIKTLTEKLNNNSVLPESVKAQNVSYEAYPLLEWHLNSKFENGKISGGRIEYITLFVVIGILVLIMAVINFVNMSTARATTRAKEIGIRKVTGAFRGSIVVQFLSESFFMVLASFILAIIVTQLALPLFNQLLATPVSLHWYAGWIPLIMILVLIVVALAAGLYPAFVMSSFQPVKILKKQFSAQGSGSDRLRKTLLIVQLSVSAGIIIFSSVMYYQLNFITNKNLGFERSNTIRMEPTGNIFRRFEVFKNDLKTNSQIISVSAANLNPLSSDGHTTGVVWLGKPANLRVTFQAIACSYEFPETIGLIIKAGRTFDSQPKDSTITEVLVTEDAVKTMGLSQPIGEHIQIGAAQCVIIGVVNNFHTESLHAARLPVVLYRTDYMHTSAVYIRYQPGTAQQSLETIEAAYKKLEASFTMKYWFQDETFDDLYKTEITASRLVLLFTIISVFIAVIGVVTLSTFNVMRKTKEMSIRRVFGASMTQVLALLSREFSIVMIISMAVAAPAAWYFADQWLAGFVYHTPVPWWMFPISFVALAVITVSIICMQGYKMASSNPAKILRSE
jgi:ABC-type antimicrobial peptide transport system permease subunit